MFGMAWSELWLQISFLLACFFAFGLKADGGTWQQPFEQVIDCLSQNNTPHSLAHHHLAELVKVHGSGTILIDLLNDAVKIFWR